VTNVRWKDSSRGCVDGYMNRKEATTVVRQELMKYRRMPYVELRRLVDTRLPTLVIKGPSGAEYQVVIQVHWEGKRGGDIRIVGLIDDFGWRVFVPLREDFITGPNDIISADW
jgi:hypothetical protein